MCIKNWNTIIRLFIVKGASIPLNRFNFFQVVFPYIFLVSHCIPTIPYWRPFFFFLHFIKFKKKSQDLVEFLKNVLFLFIYLAAPGLS